MNIETNDSIIPYNEIVQDCLRSVVGMALANAVTESGRLPGNHHFYITFKTGAPGVIVPDGLRERFTDEMTIVLQNKFWDLKAEKDQFSVGLAFSGVPTTIVVPYAAVTAFIDPSVDFALQFETNLLENDDEEDVASASPPKAIGAPGENVVSVDFGKRR